MPDDRDGPDYPDREVPTLWEKWKDLAARAATFQARVLLTLFYWIAVTPFALVVRLMADPLGLSPRRGGRWSAVSRLDPRRQY